MRINVFGICLLAALLLASGCGDRRSAEEIVTERAQARWDAIIAEDYQAAWEMHSPGFRQRVSIRDFIRQQADLPFSYDRAVVEEVRCENERCEVKVLINFTLVAGQRFIRGMRSEQTISEVWILSDSKWWYSPT